MRFYDMENEWFDNFSLEPTGWAERTSFRWQLSLKSFYEVDDATRLVHATRLNWVDASHFCQAIRRQSMDLTLDFDISSELQQKLIIIMKLRSIPSFAAHFERLSITSTPLRPLSSILTSSAGSRTRPSENGTLTTSRPFSRTAINSGDWLLPTMPEKKRSRKGRPRVPTGGSARGTTIVWGDYGLRMCDHHRRVSAAQLKNGEEAIKIRLKGTRYRLFKRVCASIGVYSSGNEVRFSYWIL